MAENETCNIDGLIIPGLEKSFWAAVLYLCGLLYCFVGIAIAADVFMSSIEKITSATKKVRIVQESAVEGEIMETNSDREQYREVPVWNGTVANLTLMALGSSAPEILLSIIEIVGNNFKSGELGPSTIVGSAAFNLLIITAICITAISSPESKGIKQIMVFVTTSVFSVFAYIWLLLILVAFSPKEVEIWEGVLTLFFMVLLVVAAYLADIGIYEKLSFGRRKVPALELADLTEKEGLQNGAIQSTDDRWLNEEQKYRSYDSEHLPSKETVRQVMRQVSKEYPKLNVDDRARMVAWRLKRMELKDRMYYRIQAARWISKWRTKEDYWNPHRLQLDKASVSMTNLAGEKGKKQIEFSARVYAVQKGDSRVRVTISRHGRSQKPLLFTVQTVKGTVADTFLPKKETLRFEANETEKQVSIELVEDAEWKANDVFYLHLELDENEERTELGKCKICEIVYVDETGSFGITGTATVEFLKHHMTVEEGCGSVRLAVVRRGRLNSKFQVIYGTEDITAEDGKDYQGGVNTVYFEENELEKYIDVPIIDDMEEEKDETFAVTLNSCSQGVELGKCNRSTVTIVSDDGTLATFRQMDRLLPRLLDSLTPGRESWREQLVSAISVNAGQVRGASITDCLLHIVCFPWKVLFACVPPPNILGGWLCFFIALAAIGVVTAVVGDVAGHFGCQISLLKPVTAITFVALGTSLPDTFASRLAARQDKTADNAIGNVTGSNSVNVFLGLGLPWLLAAIYWRAQSKPFIVQTGSLGFSVAIYTITSVMCLGLLFARRKMALFGRAELGGPLIPKIVSALFLILLWLIYVLLSALQTYEIVKI